MFIYECATQVLSTSVQHNCYLRLCNTSVYLRVRNTYDMYECGTHVFTYECATQRSIYEFGMQVFIRINVWWNGQTWQAETIMSYSSINSTEKRVRKSKSTWSEHSAREPISVSRLPTFDQSASQEWFRVLVFRLSISGILAFSNTQNRSINRIGTKYNLLGSTPERRWQT